MKLRTIALGGIIGTAALGSFFAFAASPARHGSAAERSGHDIDAENLRYAEREIEEGKRIFRYDTFGSEAFWGDALQLTKLSQARRTVASAREFHRKPPCRSASRWTSM